MKYLLIIYILVFTTTSFGAGKDESKYNDQKIIQNIQSTLEKGIKYFHSINSMVGMFTTIRLI